MPTARSTSDALAPLLSVRVRRGGERLRPVRGGPRRTLKGLLQEARVPPARARAPAARLCRRHAGRGRRPVARCLGAGERGEPAIAAGSAGAARTDPAGTARGPSPHRTDVLTCLPVVAASLFLAATPGDGKLPDRTYDAFRIRHRWRRVLVGQGHRRRLARAPSSRRAASRSRWSSSIRTSTSIRAR